MDEQTGNSDTSVISSQPVMSVAEEGASSSGATTASLRTHAVWYGLAFVGVVVVGAVLLFMLEREGRVSTSVFSGLTTLLERSEPVALVNGVAIERIDFDNNLLQLTTNASAQGVNVTDAAVVSELRSQALETLINTEVLRQVAVAAAHQVSPETIEARYQDIAMSIGGEEALAARMKELQVTEAMLRRDIENDILIQALIDDEVDLSSVTVTEEELIALYEQAGGEAAGLPPFVEVRSQVEGQIRFQKEQELIAAYVSGLREKADVEVVL